MGSPCEMQCWAQSESQAQSWRTITEREVARIEQKYSRYRADSVLSAINRSAGSGAIRVDDETAHLLNYAAACFESSAGAFDITSGVLRRVWDFKAAAPRPPTREQISEVLPHVGWSRVQWRAPTLALPAHMELDFGGIAKEYAADRAATLCAQAGARSLLVNLGGDIRVLGPQPHDEPWRIGITHPRATDAKQTIATLEVIEGGVATSGDYERFFVYEGVRYCHILDARTGWPCRGAQSVTVVAPACLLAGSHATIAMLQVARAQDWLEETGLRYLLVNDAGEVIKR
jgi:FAD:protein FMN transferase